MCPLDGEIIEQDFTLDELLGRRASVVKDADLLPLALGLPWNLEPQFERAPRLRVAVQEIRLPQLHSLPG